MSDDDYGLGLKVHEDAYRELEEELAKAKSKLEEVGYRACCVLLERDEARQQRDRITTIARELIAMIRINVMVGRFAECSVEQIDEHLKPWNEKIAAVKGGNNE
jgi:hypothetical protein